MKFMSIFRTVFALLYSLFFPYENDYCTTKDCILSANLLLNSMDPTVDPCDNFYRFTCGNFHKSIRISDSTTSVSIDDLNFYTLDDRMLDKLQEPINDRDTNATANLKRLYLSCTDEVFIESNSEQELKNRLLNSAGALNDWPLLNPALSVDQLNLTDQLFKLIEFGVSPLFSLTLESDPLIPTVYRLTMSQSSVFFPKHRYKNANLMKAYRKYFQKIAEYLNASTVNPNYVQDVNDAIDLEIEFSQLLWSEEQLRNTSYDVFNISKLGDILPTFNIPYLLLDKIYGPNSTFNHSGLNESEKVIVNQLSYLQGADELVRNASSTRPKALYNFIYMALAVEFFPALPSKFQEADFELKKVMNGVRSRSARSAYCMKMASSYMSLAAGRVYVQDFFNQDARVQAVEMTQNIKTEFKKILNEISWMDQDSNQKAMRKVDKMALYVGYPDVIFNNTILDQIYEQYQFDQNNFLKNLILLSRIDYREIFARFGKNRDSLSTFTEVAIVNAWYNPADNSITFPAGILQTPYFQSAVPKYLNYGGIGSVIGHELTHGFDDQGRLYDENGVYFSDSVKSLWSNSTIENYKNRTQCLINQYSSYNVTEVNVTINGNQTLGENIADNGGLKEAYRAYKQWEAKNGKEKLLPGLNFTQDQLFFMNFGLSWCHKYRDEKMRILIASDVHAPVEFRVIGSTSNYDQFAKVFNCKPNKRNNPANKCSIW